MDSEAVSATLISKGILPFEWHDGLTKERDRREAILRFVRQRGSAGFQALLGALTENGQSHLLSDTEDNDVWDEEPHGEFCWNA